MAERALLTAIAELARHTGFTAVRRVCDSDGAAWALQTHEHRHQEDQAADERALHDRGAMDVGGDAEDSDHELGDTSTAAADPLALLAAETERFLVSFARHVHAAHEQGNRRDVTVPDVFQAYTRYGRRW